MSHREKVLCIGIDAGDKDLIWQWSQSGDLPNFHELFQTGAWGVTQNPPGLYVGAIWPSFYTAVSPASHSRYCYRQLVPGSYEIGRVSSRNVKKEPFWDALDRAGKRVAVIDVPKTYPSPLSNGLHIVDWGSHDPDRAGFVTWPESMLPAIVQRFGIDTVHNCNAFRQTGEEFVDFRDHLIDRVTKKTELSEHYLEQADWDCFLTVFSESHCIGHQCWHLHDDQHPKYEQRLVDIAGDPIREVYKALDKAVGRLIRKTGTDTNVIVFASHGMGPHYDATFMLDDILLRLEGLPPPGEKQRDDHLPPLLQRVAPRKIRNVTRRVRNKARRALGLDESARLARRRYFPIPNNDAYGGIRINLAGREPRGVVSPGKEYDECCDKLARDLMELTNTVTREPLVNDVLRSTDLYDGENLHYLPDLLVEWNRRRPVSEICSPKTGPITGAYKKCRTGDHRSEGLVFMTGQSIVPGKLQSPVSVMDLAPTIASLIGVQLDHVDGRPLVPLTPSG